jgi:F-type H+-transporting ATPase subunit O
LAALKKSPKELESLAKDVEAFDQKIKTDEKVSAFIGMSLLSPRSAVAAFGSILTIRKPNIDRF